MTTKNDQCRFSETFHGFCVGPSNGRECWGHVLCTKGLEVCGHEPDAAALRGHELMPSSIRSTIPALYATEEVPTSDKTVYAHLFCAVFDWWVVEIEPNGSICFGYVYNRSAPFSSEWGYFDLNELDAVLVPHEGQPPIFVERETSFEPKLVGEVTKGLGGR